MQKYCPTELLVREIIERGGVVAAGNSDSVEYDRAAWSEHLKEWLDVRITVASQDPAFWGAILRHSKPGFFDLTLSLVLEETAREAFLSSILINAGCRGQATTLLK